MGDLLAVGVILALSLLVALTAARAALAFMLYLMMWPAPLFQFQRRLSRSATVDVHPSDALAGAVTR